MKYEPYNQSFFFYTVKKRWKNSFNLGVKVCDIGMCYHVSAIN